MISSIKISSLQITDFISRVLECPQFHAFEAFAELVKMLYHMARGFHSEIQESIAFVRFSFFCAHVYIYIIPIGSLCR